MSTVQRVNFDPVSNIDPLHIRDFPVADRTLIRPRNSLVITDGEWLTFDSSNKLVRASNIAVAGSAAAKVCFPCFAEPGRTDVLASAEGLLPIILLGQYAFDTRIFDAAAVVGSGAAITSSMQPLKVATITANLADGGTRNFTGLVGASYSDNAPIVGYVLRVPSTNGGKLRFLSGWAVQNGAS